MKHFAIERQITLRLTIKQVFHVKAENEKTALALTRSPDDAHSWKSMLTCSGGAIADIEVEHIGTEFVHER